MTHPATLESCALRGTAAATLWLIEATCALVVSMHRCLALSERKLQALQLIAQGLSNHEIGARLFLALDTGKGHNRRIFEELSVQRRTEAVARVREVGLI